MSFFSTTTTRRTTAAVAVATFNPTCKNPQNNFPSFMFIHGIHFFASFFYDLLFHVLSQFKSLCEKMERKKREKVVIICAVDGSVEMASEGSRNQPITADLFGIPLCAYILLISCLLAAGSFLAQHNKKKTKLNLNPL